MRKSHILLLLVVTWIGTSCTVVKPGEVGIKRKLGRLQDKVLEPGPVTYNPFLAKIVKLPIRTTNLEISSNLPSKEGLNVAANISILYRIKPDYATSIIENLGVNYDDVVISSVFRSAAADVCSRFFAKDMHTAQRAKIENEITERMSSLLSERGFDIEAVLMKNIQLPAGLAKAVEDKLEAEQDAQRMQFLLRREKLEAERKLVEAKGTRDAQKIIAEGLSEAIIKWQAIQAFKELAKSPNSKVIITNGDSPLLMNDIKAN